MLCMLSSPDWFHGEVSGEAALRYEISLEICALASVSNL